MNVNEESILLDGEYHHEGFFGEIKKVANCRFVQVVVLIGIGAGIGYAVYQYKKKQDKDDYYNTPKIR